MKQYEIHGNTQVDSRANKSHYGHFTIQTLERAPQNKEKSTQPERTASTTINTGQ